MRGGTQGPDEASRLHGVALRGHGTTIIDASPDIRHQLNREGIDVIDDFFLTHAHYDHMGGLGEFEYFIRLYLMGTMPFHGSEHAIAEALKEYSYMDDCFALDVMNPYDVREVDGLAIQALPLKHAPGTFGYLITTARGTSYVLRARYERSQARGHRDTQGRRQPRHGFDVLGESRDRTLAS